MPQAPPLLQDANIRTMGRKIVGIGETVLDIIFREDRPVQAVPGGSTFNAMISLGRTVGKSFPGIRILMATETGSDHVGDIVVSFMEENGVSSSAVTRNPGTQTHVSLAFLDENNDAQYEFYKDHGSASIKEERLEGLSFHAGDIVVFGSYFAINPRLRHHVLALLKAAREAGAVIYYDINFRKNHLSDLDQTFPFIEENCRLSDFVRGSAEDFGYLFNTSDPEAVFRDHISHLCPNFICTCGAGPVHVFSNGFHGVYPVRPTDTVSTIGAGDNFNAGFVYGLLAEGVAENGAPCLTPSLWNRLVDIAGQFSENVCRSIFNYVDKDFRVK